MSEKNQRKCSFCGRMPRKVGPLVTGGEGNEQVKICGECAETAIKSLDAAQFGLIPELIGRLPVVASVDELSVDDLVRVLSEPKDALLKQMQKMALLYGVAAVPCDRRDAWAGS
jgi:ATP-dependent protease Clp ATPase subunit